MPVLEQIADVTDRFFDAAESANTRASGATATLVDSVVVGIAENMNTVSTWAIEADVPFVERLQAIELPLVDRLPQPSEAVTSTFDFLATGIAFNRSIAERVLDVLTPEADAVPVVDQVKTAAAKPATAKKTAVKKAPAKKAPAKKAAAKKKA